MDATAGSLIAAFDDVWDRLTGRLSGLTDEEYFWDRSLGAGRCATAAMGAGTSMAAGARLCR